MISVTFPPVKCATGLRYIPLCSRSGICLVFLDFWRKQNFDAAQTNANIRHQMEIVGSIIPTRFPPGVLTMFTGCALVRA